MHSEIDSMHTNRVWTFNRST